MELAKDVNSSHFYLFMDQQETVIMTADNPNVMLMLQSMNGQ